MTTRNPSHPTPLSATQASRQCVLEVRASIAESFPAIDVEMIIETARSLGLRELPDSLLASGDIDDPSPAGLRAKLTAAAVSDVGAGDDPHPLFSRSYYDFCHPSVAAEGLSAWAHYHRWGVEDSLSPHFLLDVEYLAQSVAGVQRNRIIDEYLDEPASWFVGPSPYVETERFILSGEWDGVTHPLVQIVTGRREWLLERLMLVDSAWGAKRAVRLNAAAFLLTSATAAAVVAPLASWDDDKPGTEVATSDAEVTIVAGYIVCANGRVVRSITDDAVSADRSVVRVPGGAMSLASGALVDTSNLVVMCGPADRAALIEVVDGCPPDAVIAPFDANQEYVLARAAGRRARDIRVLPTGRQVRVHAGRVRFIVPVLPPTEEWSDSRGVDPRDLVIVVPQTDRAREFNPQLSNLVNRGARLCIASDSRVADWEILIERGPTVVVHRTLVAAVRCFSPTTAFVLPEVMWP